MRRNASGGWESWSKFNENGRCTVEIRFKTFTEVFREYLHRKIIILLKSTVSLRTPANPFITFFEC